MSKRQRALIPLMLLTFLACGFEADIRREWPGRIHYASGYLDMGSPDICVPDCSSVECGDDGCGGSCGLCPLPEACHVEGYCVPQCVCLETCTYKECGGDDCGGLCGASPAGEMCDDTGQCVK